MKKKEKTTKLSLIKPSFITSNGTVITTSLGVIVPKNKKGEPMIEVALREFKKIIKEAGILEELKDRQEYLKPSVKRRKQRQAAKRMNKLVEPHSS